VLREEEREGVWCTWRGGRRGPTTDSYAGTVEAAVDRERTGERGGTREPCVENVGRPGKKGNGPGPRENSVGFLINRFFKLSQI
jgi:hypothetical protein